MIDLKMTDIEVALLKERCVWDNEKNKPDVHAIYTRLQVAESQITEWLCGECNTVCPPPTGFNLNCKCGEGQLRPTSLSLRNLEQHRAELIEENYRLYEAYESATNKLQATESKLADYEIMENNLQAAEAENLKLKDFIEVLEKDNWSMKSKLEEMAKASMPEALREVANKLVRIGCGGCTCMAKSPDIQYHDPSCKYRLAFEAGEIIRDYHPQVQSNADKEIPDDKVLIDKMLVNFLNGYGELHGCSFGGLPTAISGKYWWRKYLPVVPQ